MGRGGSGSGDSINWMGMKARSRARPMEMPLWQPSGARVAQSHLTAFTRMIAERAGRSFPDYPTLHRHSVSDVGRFWTAVWDYCGIAGERGERAAVDLDRMPGARFF